MSELVNDRKRYKPFYAVQYIGALSDRGVLVEDINKHMCVMCEEGPIFITKEQVVDFFELEKA